METPLHHFFFLNFVVLFFELFYTLQTNVIYYISISHGLCTIRREEDVFELYMVPYKVFNPFLLDQQFCYVVCLLHLVTLPGVGPNMAISFSVYDTGSTLWHFHQ